MCRLDKRSVVLIIVKVHRQDNMTKDKMSCMQAANLDALITREDFEVKEEKTQSQSVSSNRN